MYQNTQDLHALSKDELIALIQDNSAKSKSVRNLLDNIHGVAWEFDLQADKFTCVSANSDDILGYPVQEWKDFESWKQMIHPEDREYNANYCTTCTLDGKDHFMEYRMLKKDGGVIWVLDIVTLGKNSVGKPEKLYGFIIDITKKKEATLQLQKERAFFQTIIDSMPSPMMVINNDYSVSMMNEARKKDLIGRTFIDNNNPKCYEISHYRETPCDGAEHTCPLEKVLQSKQAIDVVHNHKRADGTNSFVKLSASPFFDDNNNCTGIIEIATDITEHVELSQALQESNEQLHYKAHFDYLTGLPNRALFMDRLAQTIKDAKRNQEKFALFFMDLDHFKQVNDTYGHALGDKVLQAMTQRFSASHRDNDILARLSGDEFTLIVKNIHSKESVQALAEKIRKKIQQPLEIDGHTLQLSTSIGITLYPEDGTDVESLLLGSDNMMYKSKAAGKNRFTFFNPN